MPLCGFAPILVFKTYSLIPSFIETAVSSSSLNFTEIDFNPVSDFIRIAVDALD